eukprot:m.457647 g.457647  ORF g.457647 m.457647 type:complete len:536 (-) comp20334_c0_seq1:4753-6360(-)
MALTRSVSRENGQRATDTRSTAGNGGGAGDTTNGARATATTTGGSVAPLSTADATGGEAMITGDTATPPPPQEQDGVVEADVVAHLSRWREVPDDVRRLLPHPTGSAHDRTHSWVLSPMVAEAMGATNVGHHGPLQALSAHMGAAFFDAALKALSTNAKAWEQQTCGGHAQPHDLFDSPGHVRADVQMAIAGGPPGVVTYASGLLEYAKAVADAVAPETPGAARRSSQRSRLQTERGRQYATSRAIRRSRSNSQPPNAGTQPARALPRLPRARSVPTSQARVRTRSPSPVRLVPCPVSSLCGAFAQGNLLARHLRLAHQQPFADCELTTLSVVDVFRCPQCGDARGREELPGHATSCAVVSPAVHCPVSGCPHSGGVGFSSATQLCTHIRSSHSPVILQNSFEPHCAGFDAPRECINRFLQAFSRARGLRTKTHRKVPGPGGCSVKSCWCWWTVCCTPPLRTSKSWPGAASTLRVLGCLPRSRGAINSPRLFSLSALRFSVRASWAPLMAKHVTPPGVALLAPRRAASGFLPWPM